MRVDRIKNADGLVERLKTDPIFRYIFGFDILALTPSASTFSRLLSKISRTNGLEKDFEELVLRVKELGILDDTNVAIDSTKLDAYEKAQPKYKLKNNGASAN